MNERDGMLFLLGLLIGAFIAYYVMNSRKRRTLVTIDRDEKGRIISILEESI